MSLEGSTFENRNNPEHEAASQELTLVEKEALADAWFVMVMESGDRPLDVSEWDNDRTREWLNETLRKDTERLVDDWKLAPTAESIEQIQHAHDNESKAKIEMRFMQDVAARLSRLGHSDTNSDKWTSYPKIMRETESMNCTAYGLMAKNILDRAGIKNQLSNPVGHTMNIVHLADGEVCYFDSTTRIVKRIQPTEQRIAGVQVLELDDPEIKYRLLPLLDDTELAQPVVGNFWAMEIDTFKPIRPEDSTPENELEKREARELYAIFRAEFAANDWSVIWKKLYDRFGKFEALPAWEEESKRVQEFEAIFDPLIKEIETRFGQLVPEQIAQMHQDIRTNLLGIEAYLRRGDPTVLRELGRESQQAVDFMHDRIENAKQDNPQLASEVISYLLANWKRV